MCNKATLGGHAANRLRAYAQLGVVHARHFCALRDRLPAGRGPVVAARLTRPSLTTRSTSIAAPGWSYNESAQARAVPNACRSRPRSGWWSRSGRVRGQSKTVTFVQHSCFRTDCSVRVDRGAPCVPEARRTAALRAGPRTKDDHEPCANAESGPHAGRQLRRCHGSAGNDRV
jgi:hypothetical protein